jgi:hypothetical protein
MEKYALLGYCGLYCGGCNSFEENSGKWKCKGCKDETVLISDCPTKECAEKKQLLYCGECEGFPCDAQNAFYHDGVPHHGLALANIKRIQTDGLEKWLLEQEKEYTCQCGKRRLWFTKECMHDMEGTAPTP